MALRPPSGPADSRGCPKKFSSTAGENCRTKKKKRL
jgi:hypothetical protein